MKKMIDADPLLEWVKQQKASGLRAGKALGEGGLLIANTINELVLDTFIELITQNTITFDGDGWCHDMDKAPKDEAVLVYCHCTLGIIRAFLDSIDNEWVCHAPVTPNPIAWRPLPPIPEVKK